APCTSAGTPVSGSTSTTPRHPPHSRSGAPADSLLRSPPASRPEPSPGPEDGRTVLASHHPPLPERNTYLASRTFDGQYGEPVDTLGSCRSVSSGHQDRDPLGEGGQDLQLPYPWRTPPILLQRDLRTPSRQLHHTPKMSADYHLGPCPAHE